MAFSLPIRIPFLGKPRVRSEFYQWYQWYFYHYSIGSLKTPNGYWLPMTTFLLVVNNERRSSFATALLQTQIDPRVPIHTICAAM